MGYKTVESVRWLSTVHREMLLLTWDPAESFATSVITHMNKHCHKPQYHNKNIQLHRSLKSHIIKMSISMIYHPHDQTYCDQIWYLCPKYNLFSSVQFILQNTISWTIHETWTELQWFREILHHNENIVGAYDTESTHSEKLCPTYVNKYVCPFKPVKDSALKSTTLSGEWHQLYLYIQFQVSCKLVQELLFNDIHQNNEYFCNPFFNIKLNIAFVISLALQHAMALGLLWMYGRSLNL
jgi:hypothetical protein